VPKVRRRADRPHRADRLDPIDMPRSSMTPTIISSAVELMQRVNIDSARLGDLSKSAS
jgi:hypothetical protein